MHVLVVSPARFYQLILFNVNWEYFWTGVEVIAQLWVMPGESTYQAGSTVEHLHTICDQDGSVVGKRHHVFTVHRACNCSLSPGYDKCTEANLI